MNKAFSIQEALQFGWQITLKNFWFWAGLVLIMFAVRLVGNQLQTAVGGSHGSGWVGLIGLLIGWILQMGITRIALKFADGKKPEYKDLWSPLDNAPQFLLASAIISIITIVGLVLFLVPGLIAAAGLCLTAYLVVDKNMQAIPAIKESWRLTKGYKGTLVLFILVLAVINIIGALLFAIGLFWTIPTSMVAGAFVYRKLSGTAVEPAPVTHVVPTVPVADMA